LWERETAEVAAALASLPLDGAHVLELAPGSGQWTDRYVDRAASVLGVDASPEMVERARQRLGPRAAKVRFEIADLFVWTPSRPHDAVVVCFFLSHVPDARLDALLRVVASALRPGGALFYVDSLPAMSSGRADVPPFPRSGEVQHRTLLDGRRFDVVKNFWPAERLAARFAAAGLDADVRETATYFQYATGTKAPGGPSGHR
jgi:SAM-dependent methyltransferase